MSSLVTEVCRLLNTKKVSATAYHPQTNGLVVRFNNTFDEAISAYVSTNQDDWDLYIPAILFAYRVLPSVSTGDSPFYLLYGRNARFPCDTSLLLAKQLSPSVEEHGSRIVKQIEFATSLARSNIARSQQLNKRSQQLNKLQYGDSPFYLLYGRNARFPCDTSLLLAKQLSPSVEEHGSRIVKQIEFATSLARSNIARSQQLNKLQYDKTALDAPFVIGQHVWIYTPNVKSGSSKKFLARLYDPYRICCQLSLVHYQFRSRDSRLVATTVHANRLKPFYDPADQPILPPPNEEQDVIPLEEHDLPVGSCEPDDTTPDSTDPNTHSQETSNSRLVDFSDEFAQHDVYQTEKILKSRKHRRKVHYLVKWATCFRQYLGA